MKAIAFCFWRVVLIDGPQINKILGNQKWQLYDLKRDPFELQNLFKKDQTELSNYLSGDLLKTYFSTGFDLTAATTDFFVKYVESEMANGYQRPAYPHKFWATILTIYAKNDEIQKFWKFGTFGNVFETVGYLQPGTKTYAKYYCEDLTVFHGRFDNFRKSYNFTEEMQAQNNIFDKIYDYHIK